MGDPFGVTKAISGENPVSFGEEYSLLLGEPFGVTNAISGENPCQIWVRTLTHFFLVSRLVLLRQFRVRTPLRFG